MPARTRNLNVAVLANTAGLKKGMREADSAVDKFARGSIKRAGGGFKTFAAQAGIATLGVGGLAVGIGELVKVAGESEASNARLQAQLKASGISYQAHAKEIDNVIQRTAKLAALDDEDLQDAFTNIVRTTGSVSKSMKLVGLAADLARAKHLDVAKAGEVVAKVAGGNTGVLSRYGIQIDKNASSSEALAALQQKFAGQAEAYGKTNAGASERWGNAVENLQEKLGGALAPTVTDLTNKATKFIEQMNDGTGAGGRFAQQVSDIAADVKPVVQDLGRAASAVAKFTGEHPDLVKVAGAVLGIGVALKTLKFASSVTGFTDLLRVGKTAGTGLQRIFANTGTTAGKTLAAHTAASAASQMPTSLDARKGRFGSAFSTVGKSAGAVGGTTAAANMAQSASTQIGTSVNEGGRKSRFRSAGRGLGLAIGAAGSAAFILTFGSQIEEYFRSKQWWSDAVNAGDKPLASPEQNKRYDATTRRFREQANERLREQGKPPRYAPDGSVIRRAVGGRIPGPPVSADTVPALLSPREFVVTGGGERILEGMTFPGVLNWLEGVQPAHFATGGRPGNQIYAGYQAGLQGSQNVGGLLGTLLGYVGEPHRRKDRALGASSGGAAPSGAPSAVAAMLARAARYAGGPYDYGGGHGGFGVRGPKGGFDCSGYVSAILGPGVLGSPMAVRQPMQSRLLPGAGDFVTVGIRGSSGMNAHTMIRIGNQYFESGGGHGAARVGGWNGSFDMFHPRGLRGGGRVGMAKGGRVRPLLNTIATGSQSQVRAALSKVKPLLDRGASSSALLSYINAARARMKRKGVRAVNQRGLNSFIGLAQGAFGANVGLAQQRIDAGEEGFEQASQDLGNQLTVQGASAADVAGRQGALATTQLNQLYANRLALQGQLTRAQKSGSKRTVADVQKRLAQNQSDIWAKEAQVVGFQNDYRAATIPDADATGPNQALIDALNAAAEAQRQHTEALNGVQGELKRQTDLAAQLNTSDSFQIKKYLADVLSGQIAGLGVARGYTPGGSGVAYAY